MEYSKAPQEPNQITNTTEYKNNFKIQLPPKKIQTAEINKHTCYGRDQ